MKTSRTILALVLAVVAAGLLVHELASKHPGQEPPQPAAKAAPAADPQRAVNQNATVETPVPTPTAPEPPQARETVARSEIRPQPRPSRPEAKPAMKQQRPANQAQPASNPKDPVDKLARVALSFVGTDSDAEEYWISAINDPTLSANERKDLIEDLNEEGLPDPKHPTVDDLPLIVSRLLIIEELAPHAMDQANADAFQEAYKDLVNMFVRLTRE